MENKKREESGGLPKEVLVHFESWFHQRKNIIPGIHKKEVIQADFKSRGLGAEATMEQFDRALKLYGIRI
jgi:hypothetical protein